MRIVQLVTVASMLAAIAACQPMYEPVATGPVYAPGPAPLQPYSTAPVAQAPAPVRHYVRHRYYHHRHRYYAQRPACRCLPAASAVPAPGSAPVPSFPPAAPLPPRS